MSLAICAALHGLTHAFQLILPPLYLSMKEELRIDGLSSVMLLSTIYYASYAVMNLPYGILSDHISKKKILVFGAALNSIAFLIAASTGSYSVLIMSMILAGMGGGAYHPVANALISNLFRGSVGKAFGIIGMGASFGLFIGPIISEYIGNLFGWRISFISFGIFGCIIAAAFGLIMPEEEKEEQNSFKESSSIPFQKVIVSLVPIILIFGLRDFCLWGTTNLTPSMTRMNLNFSGGTLIGLMSLTGIVSQPLSGILSDRIGRRRVISISLILAGITVFFFPYLNRTLIFIFALISGFTLLATVPVIDASAADIMPAEIRGRIFGILMTFGILCGAVSPYVMGLIHDAGGGYRIAYMILALSAITGAFLVFFIHKKDIIHHS